MNRNFRSLLEAKWAEGKFVCVGLDSELGKIPESARRQTTGRTILNFNEAIIDATKDAVCAYKPNVAFYEAYGEGGLRALGETIDYIQKYAPDVPVILDAKFADIGNTNASYAEFAFEYLGADAVTVNPYLGGETLQPFLDRKDKGIFVLCRTSNLGADEFQDRDVMLTDDDQVLFFGDENKNEEDMEREEWRSYLPLYQYVAYKVAREWNENSNCAVVVGATYPGELREVRRIVGDMPILIPGIGAQGGDVEKTVKEGRNSRGNGMIINSSRGIIFASNGADFAEAARRETLKLHTLINQYR